MLWVRGCLLISGPQKKAINKTRSQEELKILYVLKSLRETNSPYVPKYFKIMYVRFGVFFLMEEARLEANITDLCPEQVWISDTLSLSPQTFRPEKKAPTASGT